ncbi:Gfo/Idh/MocA family protein [Microbacterium sp. MYb64]|uniref:Gfo/Idh/MocA family protein n=1 Tax=Microbacterium sp. MYb64 TaxID=1848691 RepID=UPI0015E455EC|nr:Gfo/Idh/MocA family oxidoreductase [Microbacterium sp. MYb64]
MSPYRLGLIGHGTWPSMFTLPGVRANEGVELVAVAGRRLDGAREFASLWEIPDAYDDIDAMLDAAALDGVVIASPPAAHPYAVRAAAARGVDLLCEKPIALDSVLSAATTAAAEPVNALVGFTARWLPRVRQFRDLVRSGRIGRLLHADVDYVHTSASSPDAPWSWRFDRTAEPYGVLSDLGPHALDLVRWTVGEPRRIRAQGEIRIGERRAEGGTLMAVENFDAVQAEIECVDGATARIAVSRVEPSATARMSVTAYGDGGVAHVDFVAAERCWLRAHEDDRIVRWAEPDDFRSQLRAAAAGQISDLVAMRREERRRGDLPEMIDGHRVQVLIDATALSVAHGGPIVLEPHV